MRIVTNVEKVELKIKDTEIINGKWVSLSLVSQKLAELEQSGNMMYKALRNKLYNSTNCNKYNIETICGVKCIDSEKPMKATASLELSFVKEN